MILAPQLVKGVCMAEVYASVDDLRARWPDMPPGSDSHAAVLLGDASALMRAECPTLATVDPAVLLMVCADVVRKAMQTPGDIAGVSAMNMTAGPFSQQVSYQSDSDDLFLTKKHKRLLGCGRQRAFSIDLLAVPDVP